KFRTAAILLCCLPSLLAVAEPGMLAFYLPAQGFDVYLATGLAEGEPDRETTEQDMIHRAFTDEEITAMIRTGQVVDAPSLAALTLYRLGA
ncbi:hypothetical protein AB0C31_51420, partial [Actinoplanes philippinensis]